jgi:hypothetical protein
MLGCWHGRQSIGGQDSQSGWECEVNLGEEEVIVVAVCKTGMSAMQSIGEGMLKLKCPAIEARSPAPAFFLPAS